MTQLTYNLYQGAAYRGLIYDIENHRTVSAAAEGAIPLGFALVAGTDPEKQVTLPGVPGQPFRGISIGTWDQEQVAGVGQYRDTEAVNVMKQGLIWVEVNGNVLIDQSAFFVNTGVDAGKFRADATDAEAVPTGVFRSSANSGELALLEINLP